MKNQLLAPDVCTETVVSLLSLPQAEPAAETWFRCQYPSDPAKPGKSGTVLKGSKWHYREALLAVYLRPLMNVRAVSLRVGRAHHHVAALFRKLDTFHHD